MQRREDGRARAREEPGNTTREGGRTRSSAGTRIATCDTCPQGLPGPPASPARPCSLRGAAQSLASSPLEDGAPATSVPHTHFPSLLDHSAAGTYGSSSLSAPHFSLALSAAKLPQRVTAAYPKASPLIRVEPAVHEPRHPAKPHSARTQPPGFRPPGMLGVAGSPSATSLVQGSRPLGALCRRLLFSGDSECRGRLMAVSKLRTPDSIDLLAALKHVSAQPVTLHS